MLGQGPTSEREGVLERLATRVFAWGASFLLHVAVLAVALLAVTEGAAGPPEPAMCQLSFVPAPRQQVQAWLRGGPRGATWGPSSPSRPRANGPHDSGLFGGPVPGRAKVVYIIDRSGSMTDALDFLKMKLKRDLGNLGPENRFTILFFSSGPVLSIPARRLVAATEANKRLACALIDEVTAYGGTEPAEAFQRAFAARPDVIVFLTDGEFDKGLVGEIRRANAGKKTVVNTIAFLYRDADPELRQIAAENGGTYRFVAESDLDP